jgi:hypothetical protein
MQVKNLTKQNLMDAVSDKIVCLAPGQVADVPEAIARKWIRLNWAEAVIQKPEPPKSSKQRNNPEPEDTDADSDTD